VSKRIYPQCMLPWPRASLSVPCIDIACYLFPPCSFPLLRLISCITPSHRRPPSSRMFNILLSPDCPRPVTPCNSLHSRHSSRRHASSTPAWLEATSSAGGRYGLLAFTEESASETDGAPDSPLKKISSPPDAPDLPHLSLSAGPAAGHRARSCHFE
jgi:hypothetical protein